MVDEGLAPLFDEGPRPARILHRAIISDDISTDDSVIASEESNQANDIVKMKLALIPIRHGVVQD